MTLSICIPIYNYDVTNLVTRLYNQLKTLDFSCQMICIDDCSESNFESINYSVCSKYSQYVVLNENIGRARIRNLFLNYTKSDYLLFLDCDSVVISDDFILKYVKALKVAETEVICGGRAYSKQKPSKLRQLRWKYGHQKESQPVSIRQLNPNRSFMTNNFLIKRTLLEEVKFEERLVDYGHEDTLFGYSLKKRHISITHIDNPILNGDLEYNEEFLRKTELGLCNLASVLEYVKLDPEFIEDITLLSFYFKCRKFNLVRIYTGLFFVFKSLIRFLLSHGYSNLIIFDFYKFGFFARTCIKRKLK